MGQLRLREVNEHAQGWEVAELQLESISRYLPLKPILFNYNYRLDLTNNNDALLFDSTRLLTLSLHRFCCC